MAFIFRLLFVNINPLASLAAPRDHRQAQHTSVSEKSKSHSDADVQTNVKEYPAFEVCEEDSDSEETLVKSSAPVLLFTFYSVFTKIVSSAAPVNFFDAIKCHLHPKKYLAFSILRI